MDEIEFDETITTKYFQRLRKPLEFHGDWLNIGPYDGWNWLFIVVPLLLVAAIFVVWMYVKDSRSIRWYFALPLALMRATVYGLLTYMFLLPTLEETKIRHPRTPPDLVKTSRVVLLIDVSGSMAISDDPKSAGSRPKSRLEKVVELISDSNAEFMKKILEKNPVYVYRFATHLDDEVYAFGNFEDGPVDSPKKTIVKPFSKVRSKNNPDIEETVQFAPWSEKDWQDFANYTDFKQWTLKGLSDAGQAVVRTAIGMDPKKDVGPKTESKVEQKDGGVEWAEDYLAKDDVERVDSLKLSAEDARILKGNRFNMRARIRTAKSITQGTNVAESVKAAFDAQKDNRVEGIIVFSDGQSNIGASTRQSDSKEKRKVNPELEKLHIIAQTASIPIIAIGIGEERTNKAKLVRITDLQTPDQTPPNDAFKIIVEVDGENMANESKDVVLEAYPPDADGAFFELPGKVTFDQSEPPHGQFEWTINPADLPEKIPEELRPKVFNGKDLIEGEWKIRARIKKVNEDGKDDPKENLFSEMASVQIRQKPVRVLVMCGAPNRDFQFLVTQLIRDKADLSIYVQNEAGMFIGDKSINYLDDKYRHLKEFPNKLLVDDDATETQENRWLNLARYDVIIAFDPDWSLLSREQAERLQTWVDLHAGGLLLVAGPVFTKKLTYPENAEKLEPLLNILPVIPGDYDLKMANRDRRVPRRLEFPGAAPELEFLRLDDDKPDQALSGWELFFTGKETAEEGAKLTPKRGFFDYYPVKDVKAGATVVARYVEPLANENTFDKKDPPYIVTYKYGQGWTAFLGSSEIWRFNQYKRVFFQRFWVKMSRFLASGSRKKQNRRGRVLMAKVFSAGDYLRVTAQLLDASLLGLPASAQPDIFLKPVELDSYAGMSDGKKKDETAPKKDDPDRLSKEKEAYHKQLTRAYKMAARSGDQNEAGYFEFKKILIPKEFPTGIWRIEIPIPNSSDTLSQKFMIRGALPPELSDVSPDYFSLATMATEVEKLKTRFHGKQAAYDQLLARSFTAPGLNKARMMYRFDDKPALALIPECFTFNPQRIENPQTEPLIKKTKIEPLWFKGIDLPDSEFTRWCNRQVGESDEKPVTIAKWMLVCIALLSIEWLTRKMLKLA